ncbi:MAG: Ycf66 family protein [Nodosilinea sp.]
MLAHILAVLVGLGSVALYLAAFFFPEVHRRHDFFWSGVGGFYGLVLWFCARQMTPTEALGHLASVSLLGWLGWQTLTLRRKRTPLDLQTPFTEASWGNFRRELVGLGQDFLRQTPLGRWLPAANQQEPGSGARPLAAGEIRASSLKDVGYEFLDELAPMPANPVSVSFNQKTNGTAAAAGAAPSQPPGAISPGAPMAPRPSPEPPQPRRFTPPKPASWLARATVFKDWLGEIVKTTTKTKPKKTVIEIPPRPSSISTARTTRSAAPQSGQGSPADSRSDRAVPPDADSPPAVTIVEAQVVETPETPPPA